MRNNTVEANKWDLMIPLEEPNLDYDGQGMYMAYDGNGDLLIGVIDRYGVLRTLRAYTMTFN